MPSTYEANLAREESRRLLKVQGEEEPEDQKKMENEYPPESYLNKATGEIKPPANQSQDLAGGSTENLAAVEATDGQSGHTLLPWAGRMDGLILSLVGNVRFVLRVERHGVAATLDDEDRACMDLVLTAVNSHATLVAERDALRAALKVARKDGLYRALSLEVINQIDDALAEKDPDACHEYYEKSTR